MKRASASAPGAAAVAGRPAKKRTTQARMDAFVRGPAAAAPTTAPAGVDCVVCGARMPLAHMDAHLDSPACSLGRGGASAAMDSAIAAAAAGGGGGGDDDAGSVEVVVVNDDEGGVAGACCTESVSAVLAAASNATDARGGRSAFAVMMGAAAVRPRRECFALTRAASGAWSWQWTCAPDRRGGAGGGNGGGATSAWSGSISFKDEAPGGSVEVLLTTNVASSPVAVRPHARAGGRG